MAMCQTDAEELTYVYAFEIIISARLALCYLSHYNQIFYYNNILDLIVPRISKQVHDREP